MLLTILHTVTTKSTDGERGAIMTDKTRFRMYQKRYIRNIF